MWFWCLTVRFQKQQGFGVLWKCSKQSSVNIAENQAWRMKIYMCTDTHGASGFSAQFCRLRTHRYLVCALAFSVISVFKVWRKWCAPCILNRRWLWQWFILFYIVVNKVCCHVPFKLLMLAYNYIWVQLNKALSWMWDISHWKCQYYISNFYSWYLRLNFVSVIAISVLWCSFSKVLNKQMAFNRVFFLMDLIVLLKK